MNTLIITAHPSTKGFTHKIATAYREVKEGAGHEVHTIDLYNPAYTCDFLRYETREDLDERKKKQTEVQKLIKLADEIVLVFPTWWYEAPAVLKNMFDCHFTAGFAFNYSSKGITGLLVNKTYKIFSTAGGPGWVYKLGIMPHSKSLKYTMKSCGIKLVENTIFGGRNGEDPATEAKWLDRVRASAKA